MVCINYAVFLYLPTGIPRRLACSCSRRLLTVIPPSTRREVRGSSESWFMASRIYACVSECVYLFTARPLLQVATFMGRRERGVGLNLPSASTPTRHTSLDWKQTASRVALHRWALLVQLVSPIINLYSETSHITSYSPLSNTFGLRQNVNWSVAKFDHAGPEKSCTAT